MGALRKAKFLAVFWGLVVFLGLGFGAPALARDPELEKLKQMLRQVMEQNRRVMEENQRLSQRVEELEKRLAEYEKRSAEYEKAKPPAEGSVVKTAVSNLEATLSGGVSGAYFYNTNPGPDLNHDYESKFVVTNVLLDLNLASKAYPVSLDLGLGGVATPSIVDDYPKDSDPGFDIEYADLSLTPFQDEKHNLAFTLEMGLLEPNAGYEDTYTFRNKNITVGLVASQQPYNAYGARGTLSLKGLDLYAAFYKNRLEGGEYVEYSDERNIKDKDEADNSWEAGIAGNLYGVDFTLYYYYVNGIRWLAGLALEKEFDNLPVPLYVAFNADYWKWNNEAEDWIERQIDEDIDDNAWGMALYVSPKISERFELPVRLEYAHQGESVIYVESVDADDLYAITLTPTFHPTEDSYVRVEGAYVYGNKAFRDHHDNPEDDKWYLGAEVGFQF